MSESAVVRRVARRQQLRHIVANKVTLPLTVLRELHEGRAVESRVVARAIQDLETLVASIDAYERDFPPLNLNA